jgi:hypothetical protein
MRSDDKPMRVLSLGAGVQSSTIALMMMTGEIEPVECAIFADVKAEPRRVYQWLDWLETQVNFPIYRVVQGGGLTSQIEKACSSSEMRTGSPPLYTKGVGDKEGRIRRQCTNDFKLAPIRRKVRELAKGRHVVQVIGISHDERGRAKPADVKYITNEWPLLEKQMVRQECKHWMFKHVGCSAPRSACVYCPNKCNAEWRLLRDDDPEGWAEAVRMDKVMRRLPYMNSDTFVHRSCVPLDEVDLRTDEDMGQMVMDGLLGDCEGMCGV